MDNAGEAAKVNEAAALVDHKPSTPSSHAIPGVNIGVPYSDSPP